MRSKTIVLTAALLAALASPALAGYEQELLGLINDYRASNALKPLVAEQAYEKLAREHSQDMQRVGKLSHDHFKQRFKRAEAMMCVENVGWNHQTAASQFEGWRESSGHNKNMLTKEITRAGIAKVGPYVTFFACK